MKGFAGGMQAWRVTGTGAAESRFEALHDTALTPLVGREEELELVSSRWRRARAGEGQIVLVSGEPGIGKSRLTAALQEFSAGEAHTKLRYFCSQHHQNSALYPIIVQPERAAGLARDDGPEAKLDKLAALIRPTGEIGDISLLAEPLSLPGANRFAPLDLNPQRKKERTLTALLRQLEGPAQPQPGRMIFEDLHWIDPTSRQFLDLILAEIDHRPKSCWSPPYVLSSSRLGSANRT